MQEDSGEATKRTEAMREYGVYQTIAFPVKVRGAETARTSSPSRGIRLARRHREVVLTTTMSWMPNSKKWMS